MYKKNRTFLIGVLLLFVAIIIVVLYGFYEKNKKIELYKDFRANKKLICGDTIVQSSRGWKIKSNRFFTNGKVFKTIIFCKTSE